MQIKNFSDTFGSLHRKFASHMHINESHQVQPIVIRKHPKFPSRDRNLAIRRRKQPSSPDSQKSESFDFSFGSDDSSDTE